MRLDSMSLLMTAIKPPQKSVSHIYARYQASSYLRFGSSVSRLNFASFTRVGTIRASDSPSWKRIARHPLKEEMTAAMTFCQKEISLQDQTAPLISASLSRPETYLNTTVAAF